MRLFNRPVEVFEVIIKIINNEDQSFSLYITEMTSNQIINHFNNPKTNETITSISSTGEFTYEE